MFFVSTEHQFMLSLAFIGGDRVSAWIESAAAAIGAVADKQQVGQLAP
jgi:hypothetical protein